MLIQTQIVWLFVLAIPVACVAWTITHEEVFKEPREYCISQSKNGRSMFRRKFFYLFTCEYCFSHYVTALFVALTNYKLLIDDWRGYIIGGFAIVWVANIYMSLFGLIRTDLKKEKTQIKALENEVEEVASQTTPSRATKEADKTGNLKHSRLRPTSSTPNC